MSNSQSFNQTSNSTLAKLLEVDSELAVTEAQLLSQLESVQEKRRGVKTVLCMFTEADTRATAPVESPVQVLPAAPSAELERVGSDLAPPLETSSAPATADSAPKAASDTQSNRAKKVPSSISRNKTKKLTQPPQPSKRGSGWQQYIREEYSNTSLPEAVFLVLQHQADAVLEISAIMNAIFADELPQDVGNKARRQVTNILSQGAMKNKWYRGQPGQYSMSPAAKTNVV